jgi:hypothetical protein
MLEGLIFIIFNLIQFYLPFHNKPVLHITKPVIHRMLFILEEYFHIYKYGAKIDIIFYLDRFKTTIY